MTKIYKVCFHFGNEFGLKVRALKGRAWVDEKGLNVKGPDDGITVIVREDLLEVKFIRLHGSLRVIQIEYKGGRISICVIHSMIRQFAIGNFFGNGHFFKELTGLIDQR